MGCEQKSFIILVVWRWHQLLFYSLSKGCLSWVACRRGRELFRSPSYLHSGVTRNPVLHVQKIRILVSEQSIEHGQKLQHVLSCWKVFYFSFCKKLVDFNEPHLHEVTFNLLMHVWIFSCLSIASADGKKHLSGIVFSSHQIFIVHHRYVLRQQAIGVSIKTMLQHIHHTQFRLFLAKSQTPGLRQAPYNFWLSRYACFFPPTWRSDTFLTINIWKEN